MAPLGTGPDRFRIGQRVVATVEHTAPCSVDSLKDYPIRAYAGEIGYIDYFWNSGAFIVTWKRNPTTPVRYEPGAWPSLVGPAGEAEAPLPPPAQDTRETAWDAAIDSYFDSGSGKP